MKKIFSAVLCSLFALASATAANLSEISIDIKMDEGQYVLGESIRGVVDVKNVSPKTLRVGYADSSDKVILEVFRASDMKQLQRKKNSGAMVSEFTLKTNEGQKLEALLGDHFVLTESRRYLVRPVLIHNGFRYEGAYRVFEIVPGIEIANAMQMFSNSVGKERRFALLQWARRGVDHLFLAACDEGGKVRSLGTTDIGAMIKATAPTISILENGMVIIIHRNGVDTFVRSEFWSLPSVLKLKSRMLVADPATAAQNRVRELYKESGGVKPTARPWWKLW